MDVSPKIRTCLFLKDNAEEAAKFYVSVFPESRVETDQSVSATIPFSVVEFTLAGAPFMILTGNPDVVFHHTMSISVTTGDQAETDALWERLCADGGEEKQCGWLQDRYGVHWQIVPEALPRLMHTDDRDRAARVQDALIKMKKIVVKDLEAAARA